MKAFIALFMLAAIATTGCKKDKAVDCKAAIEKVMKAQQAFTNEDTKENCKAFKAAVEEYKNSSCLSGISQAEKAVFDQLSASVGDCD